VQRAAVVLFNVILVVFTLPPYLVAKVSVLLARVWPMLPRSRRTKAVLLVTCVCWRLALALSFWVRVRTEGLREFRAQLGATGRPVVVVANHLSFLDTLLLVPMMPLHKVASTKMFVSGHLLKIPALRTIIRAMAHIVVPFKAGGDADSFELDRELMAERQRELEEHVKDGGVAGWFPEGRMNPGEDLLEVGQFRAGGFGVAARNDVEIWCAAFVGNADCWPRKAAAGGLPCRIDVEFVRLCDSSHAFAAAAGHAPDDEKAASVFLANAARDRIQASVDSLAAARRIPRRRAGGASALAPLLA